MAQSVFADVKGKSFPFTYHGTVEVGTLVGGIPSDSNVARGWLETKLKGTTSEEQIQRLVTETMVERGVSANEALDIVNKMKNLNGFKRDGNGLYYEGRQLKAALKEAVSVSVATDKIKQQGWGSTRKWITSFFPEHVFILEERLHLYVPTRDPETEEILEGVWQPAFEPTGILQQFVHTRFGSSIQYQEFVSDTRFDFTIITDYPFVDEDWEMIWTTGEMNGLGASRSQGYGTYKVTRWDKEVDEAAYEALKKRSSTKDKKALQAAEDDGALVVTTRKTRAKVAA